MVDLGDDPGDSVRVAVGIEDWRDLPADFEPALAAIG